ncbi:hypothetical protein LEMLEM_LOCUS17189, partial [Lemmus lemmus]
MAQAVMGTRGGTSRGPRFNSQQPHSSLQQIVTPVLGDPTPSTGLCR